MSPAWEYAEAALRDRFGWTDPATPGEPDAWRWWFRRTWLRLGDAGWFRTHDPGLTLFALRWLVDDFTLELDPDACPEPDWSAWADALPGRGRAALTQARMEGGAAWASVEAQTLEAYGVDDAEDEQERELSLDEAQEDLVAFAACFLALRLRPKLVRALGRAWGGRERLLASLLACAASGGTWAGEEDEQDVGVAEDAGPEDRGLSPALARAINDGAQAAFDEPLHLGDPFDMGRLNACGWVTGGCRVAVRGSPEYPGDLDRP